MKLSPSQWSDLTQTADASDIPNPVAYTARMARAGRCAPLAGWESGILNGTIVEVLCYDSDGNEAGVRRLTQGERSDLVTGVRHVGQDGLLSLPITPAAAAMAQGMGPGEGDGSAVMALGTVAAVAAAGWWAWSNWSTVSKWIGLDAGGGGGSNGSGRLRRERIRERPIRRRRPIEPDEPDDDSIDGDEGE